MKAPLQNPSTANEQQIKRELIRLAKRANGNGTWLNPEHDVDAFVRRLTGQSTKELARIRY